MSSRAKKKRLHREAIGVETKPRPIRQKGKSWLDTLTPDELLLYGNAKASNRTLFSVLGHDKAAALTAIERALFEVLLFGEP